MKPSSRSPSATVWESPSRAAPAVCRWPAAFRGKAVHRAEVEDSEAAVRVSRKFPGGGRAWQQARSRRAQQQHLQVAAGGEVALLLRALGDDLRQRHTVQPLADQHAARGHDRRRGPPPPRRPRTRPRRPAGRRPGAVVELLGTRSRSSAMIGPTSMPGSTPPPRAPGGRPGRGHPAARPGAGVLHLHRHLAAVGPHGPCAPGPPTSGGGRLLVEALELRAPAGPQLGGEHGSHRGRRHRGGCVLQLGERGPVGARLLLRQRRLQHRQGLAHLHGAALELAEHLEDLLGRRLLHRGLHVGLGAPTQPAPPAPPPGARRRRPAAGPGAGPCPGSRAGWRRPDGGSLVVVLLRVRAGSSTGSCGERSRGSSAGASTPPSCDGFRPPAAPARPPRPHTPAGTPSAASSVQAQPHAAWDDHGRTPRAPVPSSSRVASSAAARGRAAAPAPAAPPPRRPARRGRRARAPRPSRRCGQLRQQARPLRSRSVRCRSRQRRQALVPGRTSGPPPPPHPGAAPPGAARPRAPGAPRAARRALPRPRGRRRRDAPGRWGAAGVRTSGCRRCRARATAAPRGRPRSARGERAGPTSARVTGASSSTSTVPTPAAARPAPRRARWGRPHHGGAGAGDRVAGGARARPAAGRAGEALQDAGGVQGLEQGAGALGGAAVQRGEPVQGRGIGAGGERVHHQLVSGGEALQHVGAGAHAELETAGGAPRGQQAGAQAQGRRVAHAASVAPTRPAPLAPSTGAAPSGAVHGDRIRPCRGCG